MFFFLIQFCYFLVIVFLLYAVLFSQTPQRRLLSMVAILLNFSLLLIFLHFEYTAFIIIIIYVGAISVLFLFIIMLINLMRKSLLRRNFFFIFGFILFLSFLLMLFINLKFLNSSSVFFVDNSLNFSYGNITGYLNLSEYLDLGVFGKDLNDIFLSLTSMWGLPNIVTNVEIEQVGYILWTSYGLFIILAGIILVVSIIGSVSILKGMFAFNLVKKQYLSSINDK